MRKILLALMIVLIAGQAWGAERAIYIDDRGYDSDPQVAWDVLSKVKDYNHLILCRGFDPAEKNAEGLTRFINAAKWQGKKVSILLNVSDGTDAIFRPDYPGRIAAFVALYATRYTVDGINLDGVRTRYGHGLCMTDYCRTDFFNKYGFNIDAVKASTDYHGWFTPYRPTMTEWNGRVVTDAVRAIRNAVSPNVEITVSSYAHPYWEMEGALPVQWISEGLVSRLYHMDYGDKVDMNVIKNYITPFIDASRFTVAIGNYYTVKQPTWVDMYSREPRHVDYLINSISGTGDGYCVYSSRFIRR